MTSSQPGGSGYRDRNSTAERALSILELFADTRSVLTANQVSEHLGVARSTAYRYLQSLVQARYLTEAPGGFSLGLKILELARIARRGFDISSIARPAMVELAQDFRETVLLTRRMGESIVCMEREEPDSQRLRLSYEPGAIMPINAGASAMVLLAWLPDEEVRAILEHAPLRSFTPNTLTEPDALIARLHDIRERGYALSVAELDPEVVGIGAPIFDSRGTVRAAISVAGLATRLTPDRHAEVVARMVECATAISERVALLD